MGPGSCISCSSTAGPRGSATGLPIPARQGAAVCKLIKYAVPQIGDVQWPKSVECCVVVGAVPLVC
jgi:hypothetical protein